VGYDAWREPGVTSFCAEGSRASQRLVVIDESVDAGTPHLPACLSAGEVRALLREIGSAVMTCARSASLVSDDGRGLKQHNWPPGSLVEGGFARQR
jgi:hypothetical protein